MPSLFQIIGFGTGLADLHQRSIGHIHMEHVYTTALAGSKTRSSRVPADVCEKQALWRSLIGPKSCRC
jgi:hypothetical protein